MKAARYCLASAAGTTAPGGLSHTEAIRSLIMSTFPTATISFITPGVNSASGSSSAMGSNDVTGAAEEDNPLGKMRARASGMDQTGGCSGLLSARCGPFADCCTPASVEAWTRLHKLFPAEVCAGDTQPRWTPHAVVYIGGFEAPDLQRIVAPLLFEQIPAFATDSERDCIVGGRTVAGGRQKTPKYATKTLHPEFLMHEKGCSFHDPDLLQLALPHVGACGQSRLRTFLSFASGESNIAALNREEDPQRRVALRPAFGYSAAALRNALPSVVLGAAILLRRWNARWTSTTLSSAFWVSAVGHAVESIAATETEIPLRKIDGEVKAAVRKLATAAALIAKDRPEECATNYFLPLETFEQERGFSELVAVGPRLPVDFLQKMPVYSLLVQPSR